MTRVLKAYLRETHDRTSHICSCLELGLEARGDAPVIGLCRKILDVKAPESLAGAAMEVYRGQTLALRVKSIAELAAMQIGTSHGGAPIFERRREKPPERRYRAVVAMGIPRRAR